MKSTRTLIRWGLVSENSRGPYLAGLEDHGGTRTSTPLVELDVSAGTALTASGRPYHMIGEPSPDYALAVARDVWGGVFDLTGSDIKALSPGEAAAMIVERGNVPFNHTREEWAALAHRYGVPLEDDEERPLNRPDLVIPDPDEEEEIVPWGSGDVWEDLGIVSEIRATTALSILDTVRQRGMSVEAAAEIAGVDVERMRALVERRDFHAFGLDDLGEILDALERPEQGRKP